VSPCPGEDSGYLDILLDEKEADKEEPEQEEPVKEEEGEVRRRRLSP